MNSSYVLKGQLVVTTDDLSHVVDHQLSIEVVGDDAEAVSKGYVEAVNYIKKNLEK